MKWFQGTYTQRYNSGNRKSGHLFQGRYKAIPLDCEDPGYFRAVSDYIHLNPARAGLLPPQAALDAYSWSSFPAFVSSTSLPWPWLVRARVFACHDLPNEWNGSRRRYAQHLGLKVKELGGKAGSAELLEEEWKPLRRGWYCGSDKFRDWLLERVDVGMVGKQRDSYESGGMRGYDEREAGRLLLCALDRLDVSLDDVRGRRQTDAVKQAVAWWIKTQTVVGDAWICRELRMGHRVNVSRAVKRYREPADSETRKIRNMLLCTD